MNLGKTLSSTALLVMLSLLLGACVTETSGGYNVEVSEEKALKDYIALARGYLDQGDLRNTKRHLENAARLDSNNAEISAIRALVYAREGEAELADQQFRHSLRQDRNNSQTRNNYAAFMFANGRYQDAYEQLEIVVSDTEYASRAQAFENLGLAALGLQRPDDAERAFMRALQLNRNQFRSILELVSLTIAKAEYSQAEAYYRNFLTLQQFYSLPHSARSLWLGIQVANARGEESEMLRYAKQLQATFSNSAEFQLYQQLMEQKHD